MGFKLCNLANSFSKTFFLILCLLMLIFLACTTDKEKNQYDVGRVSNISSDSIYSESLTPFIENPDTIRFIDEIVKNNNLEYNVIYKVFASTTPDSSVLILLDKPAETKPWSYYKDMLVTKERVKKGKQYIHANEKIMLESEKKYSVPPHIISAIVGLESSYGEARFKRTAVQSLATIAFYYPRRADYFKKELKNLFILSAKEGVDPLFYYGSYAGAIGIPQFMPGSILTYGIDGDGDGQIDLVSSDADSIASIANYLKQNGWIRGKGVVEHVRLRKKISDDLFNYSPCNKSSYKTIKELKKQGIVFNSNKYDDNDLASLSRLDNENNTYEFIVFLENACPVHRYNNSLKYIAAISMLANKIR